MNISNIFYLMDKKMDLKEIENTIICDDVLAGLAKVPDNSVSVVWTSPPYNVRIDYGGNHNDNIPYADYLEWLKKIFTECKRVLRSGGRLIVNIDSPTNRQEDRDKEYLRPIYADCINMMRSIDMKFMTEIMWYKQNVAGRKTAWGSYASPSQPNVRRVHEYILVWSKDQFNLTGNTFDIDITDEEFQQWSLSMWDVKPETRNMGGHPVPFPEELTKRVIKLFSYRNDLILDPFSGSGTTASVAKRMGRRYVGIDNNPEFVKYSQDRLLSIQPDIFDATKRHPRRERLKKEEKESKHKENIFEVKT